MFLKNDLIQEILVMYLEGVAVQDILDYTDVSSKDLEDVLDCYLPYLT